MTTDHTDADQAAPMLPGLAPADPSYGAPGEVEAAARRTIAALDDVLDERYALATQALVTTARQLDRSTATGRAKPYGVAELLAQLREWFNVLIPDDGGGGEDDGWDELAADLRRAAAVRDPAES